MTLQSKRLRREHQTITAMIECYCRAHHRPAETVCADCRNLIDYAEARLERCPFGEQKPTCVNCPVHCYRSEERATVKEIMRFAGPRMIWQHPVLALRHLLDGRRRAPTLKT